MPLPPLPEFLRPKPTERSSGPADESQTIQAARTRARQRLVGALVLLVVGVVTFPLLFETQPRPLAVDTPIKLSQRDSGTVGGVSPAAVPSAPAPARAPAAVLPEDAGVEAPPAGASASASLPTEPVEVVMAPRTDTAAKSVVQPTSQTAAEPVSKPQAVPEPKPPVPAPAPPAAAARVTAPAAPAASATVGRFVVQVGAFSDARTLREARQKVERLGLKTYTQVIESSAGQRTRVRVGPFESRSEAEAAARTLQGGGLPAAILAL